MLVVAPFPFVAGLPRDPNIGADPRDVFQGTAVACVGEIVFAGVDDERQRGELLMALVEIRPVLRGLADEPIAEIVQCGEPIHTNLLSRKHLTRLILRCW
jgi:hypothetical protein